MFTYIESISIYSHTLQPFVIGNLQLTRSQSFVHSFIG